MSAPDLATELAATDRRLALFPQSGAVVIAVSGGPDSIVLLHLAAEYLKDRPVRIVVGHLDHRLRSDSADDAAFVGRTATALGLEAALGARDAAALAADRGWSVEEAGRRARYAFLADVAANAGAGVIATAHHADDQIETILLNLIRGTGLAGLAGMRAVAAFPLSPAQLAEARPRATDRWASVKQSPRAAATVTHRSTQLPTLVRPLLDINRAAIVAYARDADLEYRLDASNDDPRFARNRVRNEVVPALEALNPQAREALLRLAVIARAEDDFLQSAMLAAWEDLTASEENPTSMDLETEALLRLHPAVRRRVIRRAAEATGADLRAFGPDLVDATLAVAANGGSVTLPGGVNVVKWGTRLVFQSRGAAAPPPPMPVLLQPLGPSATTELASGWSLTTSVRPRAANDPAEVAGRWRVVMDAAAVGLLSVRGRVPGDKMAPLGMAGRTKSLQDLFVDEAVPAERRPGWPIVLAGFGVAWVPGLRMDERGRVRAETTRVIEIEARPPWPVP